jgi:preprotein translocase subunit SecA
VTSSIERAQKKVEENNFGIRKRLLEYDNVMNSQREVIYKRRRNALFGERLQLDILTMLFDTCEDIIVNGKNGEDFDAFKINVLSTLGFDTSIDEGELSRSDQKVLANKLYDEALAHYERKNKHVKERSLPVMQDVFKTRGATVDTILVPFTDGIKQIGVAVELKKSIDTGNAELIHSMEKMITLAIIDQQWKEHLRDMDDLKQSVQNAVYEQKDPLLIYKFEGFEAFKRFIAGVNEQTVSFLQKAEIPNQDGNNLQEARAARPNPTPKLSEKKEETRSLLQGGGSQQQNGGPGGPPQQQRPPAEKVMPVKSEKVANRNDKVSVQYHDGRVVKDVKYKTVEEDIRYGKCVVINDK